MFCHTELVRFEFDLEWKLVGVHLPINLHLNIEVFITIIENFELRLRKAAKWNNWKDNVPSIEKDSWISAYSLQNYYLIWFLGLICKINWKLNGIAPNHRWCKPEDNSSFIIKFQDSLLRLNIEQVGLFLQDLWIKIPLYRFMAEILNLGINALP